MSQPSVNAERASLLEDLLKRGEKAIRQGDWNTADSVVGDLVEYGFEAEAEALEKTYNATGQNHYE
jgi:hypothetical protein